MNVARLPTFEVHDLLVEFYFREMARPRLPDHAPVSIEQVKLADKEVFYKRVYCNVITEFLKNVLDAPGLQQIIKKLAPYAFRDADDGSLSFDGSLMLWLVVSKIDPSVIVGVELHRQKLENMKLHEYKNNVSDMCNTIERHYQRILSLNSDCESIL